MEKNLKTIFSVLTVLLLVIVPVLQMIPIPSISSVYATEEMVPTSSNLVRSFSFPFLNFMGQKDTNMTESITWYANGTTKISDNLGNNFNFEVPIPSDATITLLQNSTMIDQKVVGKSLQYDVYWRPLQNSEGIVDKYKITITGSSSTGGQIQFPIKSAENIVAIHGKVLATKANNEDFSSSNKANATSTSALGIDWSDAISSGYGIQFDSKHSTVNITVGKTFSIDPTVVATSVPTVSPSSADYSEGERRVVDVGGNLFAFYFDGSNLVYRVSTNGGSIWGSSNNVGSGTGALGSDSQRWTIGSTTVSGTQYVSVVYWSTSLLNTAIDYISGTVSGTAITWGSTSTLKTLNNNILTCQQGACVAANEANDTGGNLFLTVRWLNSTTLSYQHQEFKSTNGGGTFSSTDNTSTISTCCRPEFVLTRLASGNMLLAETTYESPNITYQVYSSSSSSWGSPVTEGNTGMSADTTKQISADSNSTNFAYLSYVTGSPAGNLKVATWTSSGSFNDIETANTAHTHSLPSITITRDNTVRIYTLAGGEVWETDKTGSTWSASTNPFGTSFNSPDDLTSAILYDSALWEENSATPYNLVFGTVPSSSADFSMSSSPSFLTLQQGNQGTSTITVTSLNGFNSAVTLSTSGAPTGVTTSFSSNPITPTSGGQATSTLTINVSSNGAIGTYTLTVTGTSGSLVHSTPLTLTITSASISNTANMGILEPMYISPYNGTYYDTTNCTNASCFAWNPVNYTKTNFPHVPLFAIINPDNGIPTTDGGCSATYIPSYQKGTANLTKSGTVILGYVYTGYGTRSISTVETEINYYHTCLPNVKGIMMDEMSTNATSANETYYRNITNYIHNNESMAYSFANPGTETVPGFQGTVDEMNIYENYYNNTGDPLYLNSTLQGTTADGGPNQWHTQYDKSTFSALEYNRTLPSQAEIQGDSPYVGFVYLTDNTGCGTNPVIPTKDCSLGKQNPWNTTSSYITTLASYLNNPSVSLTIHSFNASNNNSTLTGYDNLIYQGHFKSNNLARSGAFTPFTYNATQGWLYFINALEYGGPQNTDCNVAHYWVYNNVNYSNPINFTAPTQAATLNVYFKNTNAPC